MSKFFYLAILLVNIILFLNLTSTQHFTLYLIILHTFSVLLLIALLIRFSSFYHFIKTHIIDVVLISGLLMLAFSVYVYKIDIITPGIQGDELTIAKTSERIFASHEIIPFVPANYGHPTPLLYLTGINIKLFGKTLFAIRLTSILFGALSVAVFYILLRLYFIKTIAFATSLLMLFSYPFIIVSRLAYEITPEIFFLILSAIILTLADKTKNTRYYIALGLSLGAGLYTYVGFRIFAAIILFLVILITSKIMKSWKSVIRISASILFGLFIIITPLLSYSIGHPAQLMARTNALSPLTQNFSNKEIIQELGANISRLPRLFFNETNSKNPHGDANFKQNPSNVSMFDVGTFLLLLIGTIVLLKKNKWLLAIISTFTFAAIANDILSIERIPQAMNLYGIGHPNTLRIAGIIPIIYFIIAYGLDGIKRLFKKLDKTLSWFIFIFAAGFVAITNWYLYYEQPLNQWFSIYIYEMNSVRSLHIAEVINKTPVKKVYLSPSFMADDRIKYFSRQEIIMLPFIPKTATEILKNKNSADLIIFDPDYNPKLGKEFLTTIQTQPEAFHGKILTSPDQKVDAFIMGQYH